CIRISYAQDDETVTRGLERLAREVRAAFDGAPPTPAATSWPRPAAREHRIESLGAAARPAPARQAAPAVLLIRPAHFGTNAETTASNRFQAPHGIETGAPSAASAARAELDALGGALERAGVRVHVLDGRESPVCPDEVFPNNWLSMHADGTLVLYPMMAPSRRRERRPEIRDELERRGYSVRRVVDLTGLEARGLFLEGTGSLVL